jgi:hypothetical protein
MLQSNRVGITSRCIKTRTVGKALEAWPTDGLNDLPADAVLITPPPSTHSIVFIECNALICPRENFRRVGNFRRPYRQMYTAFDFKEKFGRS